MQEYQDEDDEVVVTLKIDYACGCHVVEHEYHDGSVGRQVIHHDGGVLVDELLGAD